jgi:hypothetical protein
MKRIYKYIRTINKDIVLPEKKNKDALTVFIEIEDLLFHTYLYDENFGFMADPAAKDPEYKLVYGPKNTPIHVYMRDHWQDFMKYLKDNKDTIEPILYTSGVKDYSTLILNVIDPNREVFETCLF